jgi:hypothetical protein
LQLEAATKAIADFWMHWNEGSPAAP